MNYGDESCAFSCSNSLRRILCRQGGGVGGYPGASASGERFGSMGKRACRSDRQIASLFFHKMFTGFIGGLVLAAFGVGAERKGEPGSHSFRWLVWVWLLGGRKWRCLW